MVSLKASGMTKNIGFSSMDSAERSAELIEKLDFDVVLLAMNATNYGNFINIALPAARKKNVGVIAMKALRDIVGKDATARELLEYVWSQEGVSSALVGHFGIKSLQENLQLAIEFSKTGISTLNKKELGTTDGSTILVRILYSGLVRDTLTVDGQGAENTFKL